MPTNVPNALHRIYSLIAPHLSSDQPSGIANAGSPGYHTSRADLIRHGRPGDYSIQCPADKRGSANNAAGMDLTLNATEMRLVTTRLRTACTPNAAGDYDPRIECLREFIGSLDGRNVCGYNRVATGSASRSRTGWFPSGYSDSSHRWHVHLSVLRDRVENENEMRGLAEVIAGVKAGTFGWTGSDAVPPVVAPPVVPPYVWDGKAYPGPQRLTVGAEGPWVAWVGDRLRVHGIPADPGDDWTQSHTDGVIKFKRAQGWSGGPTVGEATWDLLAAAPKPVKPLPTYTVQTGDTLSSIANRIDVAWQDIAELNPTVNPHKITPGLVLTVPKPVPAVTPKPTPPKEDTAVATETIFGLNILRRTDTLAGRKRYPARKPLLGKLLRDAKASVYLLIETDTTSRRDMAAELGNNFAYWGFKYHAIMWDQRVWERVGGATNQAALGENRFLLSLPLRHKASGKVIDGFDATHLENDGDTTTDGHKARMSETKKIIDRASKGNRVGFADLNSTTPALITKPNAQQEEKPRRLLHKAGARFLSSLGPSKVKNLAYGSHHGGKTGTRGPLIDDAWVMGDVHLVDGEIVRTDGTDASDHNGIKFRIKF